MRVRAQSLLFVMTRYLRISQSSVHFLALTGIELEREPSATVIHRFVNGQGIGALIAKLQADVGDFEFLA